VFNVELIFFLL